MLRIFLCACWPSVCLHWKKAYPGPLAILKSSCFILILNCMTTLYILDINPLLDIRMQKSSIQLVPFSFCWQYPFLCIKHSFRFTEKLRSKSRDLYLQPIHRHSPPHQDIAPPTPIINITCRCGALFITNEPKLTHHYHSKSIVYVKVYSYCCTFYGFW